jgi:hypothetical protein
MRNSHRLENQSFAQLSSRDWKRDIHSLNWLFRREEGSMDQEEKILKQVKK